LISGPSTGGENNAGAFVTVYGRGFGASRGTSTVTVGGGLVESYPAWSDTKITFQLGAAATTGDIVVEVPGLGSSNGLPFTVRPGNIYFAATSGDDDDDGSSAQPWATLTAAKRRLEPGDILYAMDGVTALTLDGIRAALCISESYGCEAQNGTASMPIAMVAYPNAEVIVGCMEEGCPSRGMRVQAEHWTIAQFTLVSSSAMYASSISVESADDTVSTYGQRVVGNRVTGGYYGITLGTNADCQILGNEVYDTPHSAIYHGGWGPSSDVEIAWNVVHDTGATAFGIKAYGHTPDDRLSGLWIHDNLIYETQRAAILVGGSDGATPWVYDARITNNVIWKSLSPTEGAIRIGNSGVDETELDLVIAHNTIVDSSASLQIDAVGTALVQNNLFVQEEGDYLGRAFGAGGITLDHNGYYGGAEVPAAETAALVGDPRFTDRAGGDFHIGDGSVAIDSGVDAGVMRDFDGLSRPRGGGYDLGAFEFLPTAP